MPQRQDPFPFGFAQCATMVVTDASRTLKRSAQSRSRTPSKMLRVSQKVNGSCSKGKGFAGKTILLCILNISLRRTSLNLITSPSLYTFFHVVLCLCTD